VRIELTQQLLESRSPSLGTLPRISKSITTYTKLKIYFLNSKIILVK
jgi:hypothetical protein